MYEEKKAIEVRKSSGLTFLKQYIQEHVDGTSMS